MFTSNFRVSGSHPHAVAICLHPPANWKGKWYPKLAPLASILRFKDQEEQYTKLYQERVLSILRPHAVYNELGEDAILLCYEEPGEFCHRRLVAAWIEKYLGFQVPEIPAPPKPPSPKQLDLIC